MNSAYERGSEGLPHIAEHWPVWGALAHARLEGALKPSEKYRCLLHELLLRFLSGRRIPTAAEVGEGVQRCLDELRAAHSQLVLPAEQDEAWRRAARYLQAADERARTRLRS